MRVILLSLLFVLASCGRKTYHLESKIVDSISVRVEQIKAPLLHDVMIVPEICKDSVATEFKKVYVRDTDTIIIEVKDNQLVFDVRQKEKVISELKETIQKQHKDISEKRIITKINWKPILISVGIILLFILIPKIPSTINKLIKMLFI